MRPRFQEKYNKTSTRNQVGHHTEDPHADDNVVAHVPAGANAERSCVSAHGQFLHHTDFNRYCASHHFPAISAQRIQRKRKTSLRVRRIGGSISPPQRYFIPNNMHLGNNQFVTTLRREYSVGNTKRRNSNLPLIST